MPKDPSRDGWGDVPVRAGASFETRVAGRRLLTNWVRREPDIDGCVRLTSWQELDFAALHRPGGIVRTIADIALRRTLEPVRIEFRSAAGCAVIRFSRDGASAVLVDGRTVKLAPARWAFPLFDNAVGLYSVMAQVLRVQGRMPFKGLVFCPSTLSSLEYSIERTRHGWTTSLGERLEFDRCGKLVGISLRSEPDVSIRRIEFEPPRWRSLRTRRSHTVGASSRQVAHRELRSRYDGHEVWGRLVTGLDSGRLNAAALLIGGSGLHDRFGMSSGIDLGYSTLAARLAARDIACLQFDKPGAGRTRIHRRGKSRRFKHAIELAEVWLHRLRREVPRGTPIFVIGHSEGGQIASWIAARSHLPLHGLVLLATAARPMDDVLSEQVLNEARDLRLDMKFTRRRVLRLRAFFRWLRTSRGSAALPAQFKAFEAHRHWYRGLLETTPTLTLPNVKAPVLVVQGDRDIQVSIDDARLLARLARKSSKEVTLEILQGLDHLLKPSPHVRHTLLYGDARRHFSATAARLISAWILDHCAEPARSSSTRNKKPTTTAGASAMSKP